MKLLFLTPVFFLTFSLFANEDMAIANYKKTCKKCHGSAYFGAKALSSDEWEDMFENNGKKLFNAHKKDKDALKKLSSNYYTKRREYLKDFLVKNAKDMGTIPPCNSTTCGIDINKIRKKKK